MKARLASIWEALRTSYWFLPSLMFVLAVAAASGFAQLDRSLQGTISEDVWWIYGGGPEGARAMLSAIVGSMISVTSVVFSITIVALVLASGQFGPHVLRNFMHDTGNQVVLGTFISTFIYSMMIMRLVRSGEGEEFVPYLSVTFGMLLVVASIAVLIYFIHHISTSIQAPQVIFTSSKELNQAIERLFPKEVGEASATAAPPDTFFDHSGDTQVVEITSVRDGYVQAIDNDQLLRLAQKNNLLVHLDFRPGDFLIEGSSIARVQPAENVTEKIVRKLRGVFAIGSHRTPIQDPEYGILQLVEIAVRALSPGVNDPSTAIQCLDRLGAALCKAVERPFPSPYRYDTEGELRVVADTTTFDGFVDAAFNQIRQNSGSSPAVLIRLLEAIARVAGKARSKNQLEVLQKHAVMAYELAQREITEKNDLADVEKRYKVIQQAVAGGSPTIST